MGRRLGDSTQKLGDTLKKSNLLVGVGLGGVVPCELLWKEDNLESDRRLKHQMGMGVARKCVLNWSGWEMCVCVCVVHSCSSAECTCLHPPHVFHKIIHMRKLEIWVMLKWLSNKSFMLEQIYIFRASIMEEPTVIFLFCSQVNWVLRNKVTGPGLCSKKEAELGF